MPSCRGRVARCKWLRLVLNELCGNFCEGAIKFNNCPVKGFQKVQKRMICSIFQLFHIPVIYFIYFTNFTNFINFINSKNLMLKTSPKRARPLSEAARRVGCFTASGAVRCIACEGLDGFLASPGALAAVVLPFLGTSSLCPAAVHCGRLECNVF